MPDYGGHGPDLAIHPPPLSTCGHTDLAEIRAPSTKFGFRDALEINGEVILQSTRDSRKAEPA